jgi:myo-inositol-1(or 4)-monophosphatase
MGARLNGAVLAPLPPKEEIEILSFEATLTSLIARDAPKVAELAYRLRIMGSLALSLCHLAAGRVDAVCSLKEARSVDIAAAQLLCREVGLSVELFDDPRGFGEAELDLTGRSRIAAAGTADLCRQVATALSA